MTIENAMDMIEAEMGALPSGEQVLDGFVKASEDVMNAVCAGLVDGIKDAKDPVKIGALAILIREQLSTALDTLFVAAAAHTLRVMQGKENSLDEELALELDVADLGSDEGWSSAKNAQAPGTVNYLE